MPESAAALMGEARVLMAMLGQVRPEDLTIADVDLLSAPARQLVAFLELAR